MNIESLLRDLGVGGSGTNIIKSTQRGRFTANFSSTKKTHTIPISPVSENSIVIATYAFTGYRYASAGALKMLQKINEDYSSLNFEFGDGPSSGTNDVTVNWQVIEFQNVKRVLSGQFTVTGTNATAGVTISPPIQDLSKTLVFSSGTPGVNLTHGNSEEAYFDSLSVNNVNQLIYRRTFFTSVSRTDRVQWYFVELN